MSREIIFRGKKVDSGEWVEGYYILLEANEPCIIDRSLHDLFGLSYQGISNRYKVDPSTVRQYTGFKDQKGNRIFDGDIVGFEDRQFAECGYLDYWCVGLVGWCNNVAGYNVTNRMSAKSREILQDCVVLGNKWDNPDLLEGGTGKE